MLQGLDADRNHDRFLEDASLTRNPASFARDLIGIARLKQSKQKNV